MKVLIYGAGSVGLGLGSCLLKSKADVTLIARPETVRALRKAGLVRTGIFGKFSAAPEQFSAYETPAEVKAGAFDFILVCTKSFDSATAAEDLSRYPSLFGESTKIVLCQNGWGNAEKFTAHFPKERVYSARVITGFTRHKPNEVEITVHADAIHIGSLFGQDLSCAEPLAEAIAKGGIACETTADIEKDLWAKMLYNCALNPLGAVLDVPYGVLAEEQYTRYLMDGICREVFAVMCAAGYKTHWTTAEEFLQVFYTKLVPPTAEHKSSTLQDIRAGKKTEIDALTGAVLELASQHDIPVPYNQMVYSLIKFLESRNR